MERRKNENGWYEEPTKEEIQEMKDLLKRSFSQRAIDNMLMALGKKEGRPVLRSHPYSDERCIYPDRIKKFRKEYERVFEKGRLCGDAFDPFLTETENLLINEFYFPGY